MAEEIRPRRFAVLIDAANTAASARRSLGVRSSGNARSTWIAKSRTFLLALGQPIWLAAPLRSWPMIVAVPLAYQKASIEIIWSD
jgi:hypothetical protein